MELQPTIDNQLKDEQLALLRERLEVQSYPGYPTLQDRLVTKLSSLAISNTGDVRIADGVWTVDTHANRTDVESEPTRSEQQAFREQGLALDSRGRPLHPWLKEMIEDPGIGIVNGKGAYWNWGPNYTADAVVFKGNDVLLINRQDTGSLALPGGYLDEGEYDNPELAARREANEESGIVIPDYILGHKFVETPVLDLRTTANAWAETTGYYYEMNVHDNQVPKGADDALRAGYFPLTQALYGEERLRGAHCAILLSACYQRAQHNAQNAVH